VHRERGNSSITSQFTNRCLFRSPRGIPKCRSSANSVHKQGNLTDTVFSSPILHNTQFSLYSLLLPPISPSTPWLNELQPCLVVAGSPYKAWGWSQQAAINLPSITTPLTSSCRLPHCFEFCTMCCENVPHTCKNCTKA
jgi:hypothetical protein